VLRKKSHQSLINQKKRRVSVLGSSAGTLMVGGGLGTHHWPSYFITPYFILY
jgi:hypothetical protein